MTGGENMLQETGDMCCAVVLSTYNGARYLNQQLDSIAGQTRGADLVVVSDDGSSDNTVELVREYIDSHGLANWRVTENVSNKGWAKNFHDLITGCDADLIFPCDQDDIWVPDKLEKMIDMMSSHPEVDVLAAAVEPVFEEGSQIINVDLASHADDIAPYRQPCVPGFLYVKRPGSAMCVRSSFVREIGPYWVDSWPHDATLIRFACVKGSLYYTDFVSMLFRRHAGNASSRADVTRDSRLESMRYYSEVVGALEVYAAEIGSDAGVLAFLRDYREWFQHRADLLSGNGRAAALWRVAKWRKLYATSKGFPMDIACLLFPNADFKRLLERK